MVGLPQSRFPFIALTPGRQELSPGIQVVVASMSISSGLDAGTWKLCLKKIFVIYAHILYACDEFIYFLWNSFLVLFVINFILDIIFLSTCYLSVYLFFCLYIWFYLYLSLYICVSAACILSYIKYKLVSLNISISLSIKLSICQCINIFWIYISFNFSKD